MDGTECDPGRPGVLIIEPSSSGLDLLAAVSRAGYQPVVLSYNADDRLVPAGQLARWGAELVAVETNDRQAVLETACRLRAERAILGVLPGFEFYVPLAAEVAAALNLPGLSPAAGQQVRDKHLMRRALACAEVTGPEFRLVTGVGDLADAAAAIGFPLVVKPTRSAGSVHVSLVASLAEACAAYTAISDDHALDLGTRLGADVLLEEYLSGPEYSVEGFVQHGRTVVVSITEKLLSAPPHFIELGHTVPASLAPVDEARIAAWTADVVAALGADCTVFHLELRLRDGQPQVIEFGARLPGDSIGSLIELSRGVCLADIFVQLATGHSVDPDRLTALGTASAVAAIRFFYEPGLDVVRSAPSDSELQLLPNVVGGAVTARPGDRPNGWFDFRSRLGWVLMTGTDRPSVDRSWDQVRDTVRFT